SGVTDAPPVYGCARLGASTNGRLHPGSMSGHSVSLVTSSGSARASAKLDNSAGSLEANQVALTTADLVNHGGTITQYGSSAMVMNVSGMLDNSAAGVIQTNSTDLTLTPAELNNAGRTITHAGTGTLKIAPGHGASSLRDDTGTRVTKGQAIAKPEDWHKCER
ncbi:hypothetical protein, partial [Burkholderia cenocepacia]|uniref:hypothetical protein n=1 Tax=Burkholderia cenocepacia TaxID=95486 RepID=UPI00406D2A88